MMTNDLPQLPKGWAWVTPREIAEKINPGFPSGKHNKESRGVPHLRPMNVSGTGNIDLSNVKFVEASDYESLSKGDVLFNNTNSPEWVGKTSYIRQDTNWAYSNHMTRIRLVRKYVNSAWIAFSLHHLFLSGYFKQNCTHHVNQASINSSFLADKVRLPFPPLLEQHRIVAKIEELFSDLDAGVAALQKTKAQLKRYRQAVLKAAVEGNLTAEWRAANAGKIEPASVLLEQIRAARLVGAIHESPLRATSRRDAAELGELPEGWVWATLQELSWDAGYGTSVKCDYGFDGAPVLRIPNIAKGRIDLTDLKCSSNSDSAHFDLAKSLAKADLLIVRTNGSRDLIGRAALVNSDFDSPHYFASYLIRFRLMNQGCLPFWINTFWDSTRNRAWIEGVAATTAGQYNVSMTVLNKMPIPLPPLAEQQQIVAEVERRLSVADEIEKTVDASLSQAERLRQSILKRAFAGKLVPQDPSDEPAERLLERIRAGRGAAPLRPYVVRSNAHSNAVRPNAVRPNAHPNAVRPDAVDPNAIRPNPVDPNAIRPNAVDPDAARPNDARPKKTRGKSK